MDSADAEDPWSQLIAEETSRDTAIRHQEDDDIKRDGELQRQMEDMEGVHEGEANPPPILPTADAQPAQKISDTVPCDPKKSRTIYLITWSHTSEPDLRAPKAFSREETAAAFRTTLDAVQAGKTGVTIVQMAVFLEKHDSDDVHYHVAVKLSNNYRFTNWKRQLQETYKMAVHFSTSGVGYASAISYCYLPRPHKPIECLDRAPYLWAANGEHPPLAVASVATQSATAMVARREQARRSAAATSTKEPRFKDVDLWGVIVGQNIKPDKDNCARERLMTHAKECGGASMVAFCFKNWDKLPDLIDRVWAVEDSEAFVAASCRSRMDFLETAADGDCSCNGRWLKAADELLDNNKISKADWCAAVLRSLRDGRSKGTLVCHAGLIGDEGKSFLLEPLLTIFGKHKVFGTPPKSAFPLMALGGARLALLDDWRFNDDIIPYNLQLLWFEGKQFQIARPQNQHSGHTFYDDDAPVFITTLESDIKQLKSGLQRGDVEMMTKRLHIFPFHEQLKDVDRTIPTCGTCFAKMILGRRQGVKRSHAETCVPPVSSSTSSSSSSSSSSGSSSSSKPKEEWAVSEVCDFLKVLELSHLEAAFRNEGIDGSFLRSLSEDDLVKQLGLSVLQARKIKLRF